MCPRQGRHTSVRVAAPVERAVRVLLRQPSLVVVAALILVAVAGYTLRGLGTELLPPADPRQFAVRLVGSSWCQTVVESRSTTSQMA